MAEITEKKVILGAVLAGFAVLGFVLNFKELTQVMLAALAVLLGVEGYRKFTK